MRGYKTPVPGVWVPDDRFSSISHRHLGQLVAESSRAVRKRSRVCVHPGEGDRMQEMFIAFAGDSYIRPSLHAGRDESIHFIRGRGKYIFFAEDGTYQRDVRLGTYDSDLPFYLRVPADCIHSLIPLSPEIVAHEVVQGPFERNSTHFPAWAIPDGDSDGVRKFMDDWAYAPVSALHPVRAERISEEAFQCTERLVYLRRSDVDMLREQVPLTRRKRVRLLVHPGTEHALHEMVVVYTRATYVRPNLHVGKDESLHIIEGDADFVFFDDLGNLIRIVELSASDPNKDFFIRVPQSVFHTIVMKSEILVIHEATPGPFVPSDTKWAPWAPGDEDALACERFSVGLQEKMDDLKRLSA
jgi:cupin fold WbuC family metalloprotein